ncbi:MAG: hypothetical protein QOC55_1879 [Thermoleophilaceae bacterium]|jgi:hypothetical protein|nr:hypothetical protein [Thermoleophilaceae bacterium]
MSRLRSRLTFANVVSVLALFVALGGTATAAAVLITGKNVKDGTLTGKDIKNNSVGSVDIKDGNLLGKDFKAGQLPKGDQGPKGDPGANGTNGTNGAKGDTGTPGTARAYALNGSCGVSAPGDCTMVKSKGIAYIHKVADPATYCVGVTGIDASAPDSVAVVAPAGGSDSAFAEWLSSGVDCATNEFEVVTGLIGTISVRNAANNGSETVSWIYHRIGGIRFTIAIL